MFVELVRHGGQALSRTASVSLDDGMASFLPASGMLAASAISDAAADEHLESVRFSASDGIAVLENRCRTTSCRINGQPVALRASQRLHDGDQIEVGLTMLRVTRSANSPAPDSGQPRADQNSDTATAGPAVADDLPGAAPNLDFSDLIALAGPQTVLGMLHKGPADLHAIGWSQADTDSRGAPAAANLEPALDNSDPLAALSLEYRRALLNHERDSSYDMAAAGKRRSGPLPEDPFALYADRLAHGSLQDDLLGVKKIDSFISEMDHFGGDALFAEESPSEILRLLAPPGAAVQLLPPTGQLSQREHHLISMDSHFHISGTTTDTNTDTNQDHA
jgi:hypothetical protein